MSILGGLRKRGRKIIEGTYECTRMEGYSVKEERQKK